VNQRDRVVGEQRVRASRERQMVLHLVGRLLGGQAGDRVAHPDPLVQRRDRALTQTTTQRGLAEQQQTERGGLVHPHVAQAADALQALRVQEVGFIQLSGIPDNSTYPTRRHIRTDRVGPRCLREIAADRVRIITGS
jgi:hypothetical protein